MRHKILRLIAVLPAAACSPTPGNAGGFAPGQGTGTDDGPAASTTTEQSTAAFTGGAGTTGAADEDSSDGGVKLDVGVETGGAVGEDCSPGPGGAMDGREIAFSNIWVADMVDATVFKTDTRTLEILGRYRVHPDPDAGGSPSRTSVSLNGDVAVANRGGRPDGTAGQAGVTVVATRLSDCVDANDDGTISTSSGINDVLPWGEDECVLWHKPLDSRSNRPVAWTSGVYNEDTCRWEDTKVWTATNEGGPDQPKTPKDPIPTGTTDVRVYLLDGATGEVEGEVVIPDWDAEDDRGAYGGAVDSEGDFWFVAPSRGNLGHVRLDDLSYETFPVPGNIYGMMVDSQDRVWVANSGISRYDPGKGTWDTGACGCSQIAESPSGEFWGNGGRQIDPDSLSPIGAEIGVYGHGIAFDVDGFLWSIDLAEFVRIDVSTGESQTVFPTSGSFYTYSDMTGWGLLNVQAEG